MNNYIVTTTIQPPTEATLKFAEQRKWTLLVVGDKKTPHELYEKLAHDGKLIYLSPDYQEKRFPELCKVLPWNCIQRRNIGFIYAYLDDAKFIATIDDDNIPYSSWDRNPTNLDLISTYHSKNGIFDPLSVTNHSDLWHRGYPVELIPTKNNVEFTGKEDYKNVDVIAHLWDGDPDIDATLRLTKNPMVKFEVKGYYSSNQISPFNSQNTILTRRCFPYYAVLPFVGRMDDIWGGYYMQQQMKNAKIVYGPSTVFQDRNKQDLVRNLENELLGYRKTLEGLICKNMENVFPDETKRFYEQYRKEFK